MRVWDKLGYGFGANLGCGFGTSWDTGLRPSWDAGLAPTEDAGPVPAWDVGLETFAAHISNPTWMPPIISFFFKNKWKTQF
jgi:hypothetical protein